VGAQQGMAAVEAAHQLVVKSIIGMFRNVLHACLTTRGKDRSVGASVFCLGISSGNAVTSKYNEENLSG
jgi:hypothetical protein